MRSLDSIIYLKLKYLLGFDIIRQRRAYSRNFKLKTYAIT